ncbi:MAG: helix-hairpin-helix domain-containing protein [Candidatus Helarchaeota archaeon]
MAEKLDIDIDEVIYWIEQASRIKGVKIPEAVIEQTKILSKKKKMEEIIEEESEYIEEELEGTKEELEEPEKEIEEGLKEELVSEEIESPESISEKVEEDESISEEAEEDVILKAEEELLKCKGMGKKIAQKLINAGIFSLKDFIEADLEELAKSSGIPKQKLKKFQEEAEKII